MKWSFPAYLLLIVFLISSCAMVSTKEEIQNGLSVAHKEIGDARSIALIGEKLGYRSALDTLENELRVLRSKWHAMPPAKAKKSVAAITGKCKNIIKKMRQEFSDDAKRLKQEAEKGQNKTLVRHLPEINKIIATVGNSAKITNELLKESAKKISIIRTETEKILEVESSFGLGKHSLSETGKRELERFHRFEIAPKIESYAKKYKNESVVLDLDLTIIGYTDETGFHKQTARQLSAICGYAENFSSRKQLNKCLSEQRVKSINDHFISLLLPNRSPIKLNLKTKLEAKGEEMPPELVNSPHHPANDSRRRIAKIRCYFNINAN